MYEVFCKGHDPFFMPFRLHASGNSFEAVCLEKEFRLFENTSKGKGQPGKRPGIR